MAQVAIGSLRVDLGLDSAQFRKSLNRTQKQTQTFGKQLSRQLKGIATTFAATFASGAILRGMNQTINRLDAIGKTADKIGVSVEALQELRFAADQSGVAVRTFDMALQRFTRRAAEAAQGTGEAREALKQLGIQLRDNAGVLRPTEALLADVADAFRQIESPAERVRLSFKLFDSEGVAVVNMLREGSEGLARMREEARRLGIVMREDMVRDAEKMKDELSRHFQALGAQWNKFVITFLRGADRVFGFMPPTTDEQLAKRIGELRRVQDEIRSMTQEGGGRTLTQTGRTKQLAALREREAKLLSEIRTMEELRQARERANEALTAAESGLGGGGGGAAAAAAEERKASLNDVLSLMEQEIAALDRRAAVVGMSIAEEARFLAETEALNRARELGLELSERDREVIRLFAKDVGDAAKRLQEARGEFEKTGEATTLLSGQFSQMSGVISNEFSSVLRGAQSWSEALVSVLGRLRDRLLDEVFKPLEDAIDNLFSQKKGGGGILGGILGAVGGLIGGSVGSIAPSGATFSTGTSAGVGRVPIGFAHGGSFEVGGTAGIDRNMVSFRASRGERVTIDPPGGSRERGGNTFIIDNSNSTAESYAALKRVLFETVGPGKIERRAVAAVADASQRGHRVLRGNNR